MKAYITETIRYEVEIPDSVDPTDEAVEEWFVEQDVTKLPIQVLEREAEIQAELWKVQTSSANGWADIKTSKDGETYMDDHYASKEEADSEMECLRSGEDDDGWRVVPASAAQQDDLYE